MQVVRVRQKGQVTLPKRVREKLGIGEGDLLRVEAEGGQVVLEPLRPTALVVRPVPAEHLREAAGLVDLGGNALEDSEAVFE